MRTLKRLSLLAAAAALALAGQVATAPAPAAYPGANGRLAFTSPHNEVPQIFTIQDDGTGKTRITDPPRLNFNPFYNSDADMLYFATQTPNGTSNIFSMLPTGHLRTQVTTSQRRMYLDPTVSPDGSQIMAVGIHPNGGQDLFLMNSDGTGITRFTNTDGDESGPVFSPGGGEVAYSKMTPKGNSFIVIHDISGAPSMRLTPRDQTAYGPSFDPSTGTRLIYTKATGAQLGTERIFRVNTDGTGITKIADTPKGEIWYNPVYSPDSSRIAAVRLGEGTHVNRIVTMDSDDGLNRFRVTNQTVDPVDVDWGVVP
jgi:TolB protein